jgi:flagellar hook-basal body complex protein FliE
MDIKSVDAFRSYAQARQAAPAAPDPAKSSDFTDVAKTVAKETVQTLQTGEQIALDAISGNADPTAVVQALAAAELTLDTATTIRDRVIEAYQEILRMPV